MPARKYVDIAHLSPEEYRKEAERRRYHEKRKEYCRNRYLNKVETPEKLEDKLLDILARIEKLKGVASEQ
jgi:hypothetical protein